MTDMRAVSAMNHQANINFRLINYNLIVAKTKINYKDLHLRFLLGLLL